MPEQIPTLDVTMEELKKHDVSGDRIRSDETVSDRLYRGGVKALHRQRI